MDKSGAASAKKISLCKPTRLAKKQVQQPRPRPAPRHASMKLLPKFSETTQSKSLRHAKHQSTLAPAERFAAASKLSQRLVHAKAQSALSRPKEVPTALKPNEVLRQFSEVLRDFEKGEVLNYAEVFYVGQNAIRARPNADARSQRSSPNGDNEFVAGDHIAYRYEVGQLLGKGSFGQVFQCFDHKRNEQVAVKLIRGKKRFYELAATEINILQRLNQKDASPFIVCMKNYFMFRGQPCLVFELMGLNLYEFLKRSQGLSVKNIRILALQILESLKILRKHSVIHCDLKPENLLLSLKDPSHVKLIDFGAACYLKERVHTYIQSRFYRAPEVLLGVPYTLAIDMWSFGCLLYELRTRMPLFPGEDEADQYSRILELKGHPPAALLAVAPKKPRFYDGQTLRPVLNKRGFPRLVGSRSLGALDASPQLLDLIERCLEWDPVTRITPAQALAHPFFRKTED